MSAEIMGSLIVVVLILARVIEHFVIKRKEASAKPTAALTPGERQALFETKQEVEKVKEIVCKSDDDGKFLIYSPRSLIRDNEQMLDIQKKQAYALELLAKTQEQTIKLLEKINDKLDRLAA